VSVQDGMVHDTEPVHTDVVRWMHVEVPVAGCIRFGDVIDGIRKQLGEAAGTAEGRMLACRIHLKGQTELHGELLASGEQLLAEARAAALALGEEAAWVLNVVNTTMPAARASSAVEATALNDLNVLMAEACTDSELLAQVQDELGELMRKLPHEVTLDLEDPLLQAAADKDFSAVVGQASAYLTARLGTGR